MFPSGSTIYIYGRKVVWQWICGGGGGSVVFDTEVEGSDERGGDECICLNGDRDDGHGLIRLLSWLVKG